MTTYANLRDRALNQVGLLGQSEAQTVAQIALEEAMKFVASRVRIPSLLASATADQTATSNPSYESNALSITGASDFNISASVFQCVDRLYIKKDSSAVGSGIPYEPMEYHYLLDLMSIPAPERDGIYGTATSDETPSHVFTVTPSSKIWAMPVATGNVYTLIYRTAPAAYSGVATPEITPLFDYILVNGAVAILNQYLRDPVNPKTAWQILIESISKDCDDYANFLAGGRRRTGFKLHRSYRTPQ